MQGKLITLTAIVSCFMILIWSSPSRNVSAGQDEGYIKNGQSLYRQYCAACHGTDARGSGPAAIELRRQPSDLTLIQKSGEPFPIYQIMTLIEGEKAIPVHGTRDMPIWGKIFRRSEGEARAQSDIYALAKYIESIQSTKK